MVGLPPTEKSCHSGQHWEDVYLGPLALDYMATDWLQDLIFTVHCSYLAVLDPFFHLANVMMVKLSFR